MNKNFVAITLAVAVSLAFVLCPKASYPRAVKWRAGLKDGILQKGLVSPPATCQVEKAGYFAQLGHDKWSSFLDHNPPMTEVIFSVPEIYLVGDITGVSSLDGIFYVTGSGLDCATVNPRIYVKAVVPGHQDNASEPWTLVSAMSKDSSADTCSYTYSVPTSDIKEMFLTANTKHGDFINPFGHQHNLAVVMKTSNACDGWASRYYMEVYENSTKTTDTGDPIRAWNADFGEP